jgi:hypothetical protein
MTPVNANPVHKGSLSDGAGGALLSNPSDVYVSGNYAYVTSYDNDALEIVDISDPANPVHLSSLSDGAGEVLLSGPSGVFVSGNYAYITGAEGLEIVDVSNPAVPVHAGSISPGNWDDDPLHYWSSPSDVFVSGNSAYVISDSSFAIIDISNPTNPVIKGGLRPRYPRGIYVSDNYAYLAKVKEQSSPAKTLEIIDVSNPTYPIVTGGVNQPQMGSVYVAGNNAYLTSGNSLEIFDISDPMNPVHKSSVTTGSIITNGHGTRVYIYGNYAYVVSYANNAIEIVDVSDPSNPVHKGSIQNGEGGALLNGPLSIFVNQDFAYVVGDSNALEIIDLGTVTATDVNVVSPTQITGTFNFTNKTAGDYNVVVTNPDGQFGTLSSGFSVSATATIPVANFTTNVTSGPAPLAVQFNDTSTGSPTSWNWSFGDNSWFNTTVAAERNTTHIYTISDSYTAQLTVANEDGTDTTDPATITVNPAGNFNVYTCRVLDSPGTYTLQNDILNSDQTVCIEITSRNIIFDGNDHTISGTFNVAEWPQHEIGDPDVVINDPLMELFLEMQYGVPISLNVRPPYGIMVHDLSPDPAEGLLVSEMFDWLLGKPGSFTRIRTLIRLQKGSLRIPPLIPR